MRCGLTLAVGVGPESFGLSHHQVLATGFGSGQDGQLERLGTDADALLLSDDQVSGGGGGDVDHGVGSFDSYRIHDGGDESTGASPVRRLS